MFRAAERPQCSLTSFQCLEDDARVFSADVDKWGRDAKLLSDEVFEFVEAHARDLNAAIDYSRDFDYDYFGFKTLERYVKHSLPIAGGLWGAHSSKPVILMNGAVQAKAVSYVQA